MEEQIIKKVTHIILTLLMIILLAVPAMALNGDQETVELASAGVQLFDANTDYMSIMINAAITGDVERGKTAEAARNAKRAALGMGSYPVIAWEDLYLLSKIIYAEAGSLWLSDEHQRLVGSVLLNRVASPEFPDDIESCVYQPGQYYSRTSTYFARLRPDLRAVMNAKYLLENGSIAPKSVVFQANFRQGSGVYKVITDRYLPTTYFCYSSRPWLYK